MRHLNCDGVSFFLTVDEAQVKDKRPKGQQRRADSQPVLNSEFLQEFLHTCTPFVCSAILKTNPTSSRDRQT
jgi:hypothetical protein